MNTCETCKHWGEFGYQLHEVRECEAVPMLWESFEWTKDYNGRVLKAGFENKQAFVQDGSDYSAALYTKKDFGCNQWEAKE